MKYMIQPRVGYAKRSYSTGVIKEIERVVEETRREFRVSRSFIIATVLADYFGIREQVRYDQVSKPIKLRRMK